jgi:hypothetical protein
VFFGCPSQIKVILLNVGSPYLNDMIMHVSNLIGQGFDDNMYLSLALSMSKSHSRTYDPMPEGDDHLQSYDNCN